MAIIRANAERMADFAAIATPTLVLDGTATRPHLRKAAAALTATIPGARRVSLEGLFHAATQNRDEFGSPNAILPTLLDFLALRTSRRVQWVARFLLDAVAPGSTRK